jgi:peptidoglycan/LPS O-acetylase OafA/YrhL
MSVKRNVGRQRLGVINGLRGLAILGVLYTHIFIYKTPPGWHASRWGDFQLLPFAVLSNGWLGVNLFFMLSGFVLSLPYAQSSRTMASLEDVRWFYVHRFMRLMPLYYISSLVIEVFLHRPDVTTAAYWSYVSVLATATFNFAPKTFMPPTNFVLWSLGIEIWFSILFPILVAGINRWGMRRVLAVVLVLSLATRFADVLFHDGHTPNWVKDSLLGRLDDFVVGMAACRYYLERRRQSEPAGRAWAVAGMVLGLLACELCDYVSLGLISPWARPIINNVLQASTFLILVGLLFAERGLLRALMTSAPLQLSGMMCYSLYIWHASLGEALPVPPHRGLQWYGGYFVMLIVLSLLSYRYIEFGREPDVRKLFRLSG